MTDGDWLTLLFIVVLWGLIVRWLIKATLKNGSDDDE